MSGAGSVIVLFLQLYASDSAMLPRRIMNWATVSAQLGLIHQCVFCLMIAGDFISIGHESVLLDDDDSSCWYGVANLGEPFFFFAGPC